MGIQKAGENPKKIGERKREYSWKSVDKKTQGKFVKTHYPGGKKKNQGKKNVVGSTGSKDFRTVPASAPARKAASFPLGRKRGLVTNKKKRK